MWFGVVSIFPEMFASFDKYGVVGRAINQGVCDLTLWNPRNYAQAPHYRVDDRPYGGGPGMVMQVKPIVDCISAASEASPDKRAHIIALTPQGKPIKQRDIVNLSKKKSVIFVAGRYEGIDERVIDLAVNEEWSLGDYILSGGELAVMVILDALIRLLPGVLGNNDSLAKESFSGGLLDYPQYAKPQTFAGLSVPKVLLCGHHKKIALWRHQQRLLRTSGKRPDLYSKYNLTDSEISLLSENIC